MRAFVFLLLMVAAVAGGFHLNASHKKSLRDWDTEMAKCKAEVMVPLAEMLRTSQALGGKGTAATMAPADRIALLGRMGRPIERLIEVGTKGIGLYEHKPGWFGTEGGSLTDEEEKDLKKLKDGVAMLSEFKASAPKSKSVQPMPSEVTVIEPVQIHVGLGAVALPVGTKVRVVAREGTNLRIQYLGNSTTVPEKSTNFVR